MFDEGYLRNVPKMYSQFREDVNIRAFFEEKEGGFFVELGAYNWCMHSTTYILESQFGWSGLAVDARAEVGEGFRDYRRNTKFRHCAIGSATGDRVFYRNTVRPGLSSIHPGYLATCGETQDPCVPEEVPTITVDDLLQQEGVTRMDFLSVDIEGAELDALSGFSIERYRPSLVLLEKGPAFRHDLLLGWFDARGYRVVEELAPHDKINWYFTPKGE